MRNSHHSNNDDPVVSHDGQNGANDNGSANVSSNGSSGSTDPARLAVISALAAFSEQSGGPPPSAGIVYDRPREHSDPSSVAASGLPMPVGTGGGDAGGYRNPSSVSRSDSGSHAARNPSFHALAQDSEKPQFSGKEEDYSHQAADRRSADNSLFSSSAGTDPTNRKHPDSESDQHDSDSVGGSGSDSGHSERDDDEERERGSSPATKEPRQPVPRGKPEAMAVALAQARVNAEQKELEEDEDDDDDDEEEAIAEPVEEGGVLASLPRPPLPPLVTTSKASKKKSSSSKMTSRSELLLSETPPAITRGEYENLQSLMVQFCRVPLLAEFSRPVALLHPEVSSTDSRELKSCFQEKKNRSSFHYSQLVAGYSKIVTHPVDLGLVCRGIRRRKYKNTRDVRLDMWRVFANCVKFHSHPNNKEAVPSFVSIALHLRDYFNNLWQEYMLPSDLPTHTPEPTKIAFQRRDTERRKRVENCGVLIMSPAFAKKTAANLEDFINGGGCVDKLDKVPVFGPEARTHDDDVDIVATNLAEFKNKLMNLDENNDDCSMEAFFRNLKGCIPDDVFESDPAIRNRISQRLGRFAGKIAVPLYEANARGVTQSSIWGNIATAIWARESSKKPYWPALCLGILPPEDQREEWHDTVTERNEARLPERLRSQLMTAKIRCEQAQKRQSLSYFLVEFLGTHEFIWVRETDIVENFDPNNDPNKKSPLGSKKKRTSRSGIASVVNSKTYTTALEECTWATEEFEAVLAEVFEVKTEGDEDDDEEEMNYSYSLLAQSDDEADEEDNRGFEYDDSKMSSSDVDEANWLLTHDGKLDTSAAGRKNAKRRAQALKKRVEKEKKDAATAAMSTTHSKKKSKVDSKSLKKKKDNGTKKEVNKTRDLEDKKELRELEKRRKKRQREREKTLRGDVRKQKRKRTSSYDSDEDERGLVRDKRSRATAIVKAYVSRMSENEAYKSLGLGGVMTIPAAMVDSTGLLGMALAFRAASGELAMPDCTDEYEAKLKPWTAIDTDTPRTSSERMDRLEEKIRLIQKQIASSRRNTEYRRELTVVSQKQSRLVAQQIDADDEAARLNHFRKKKKAPSRDDTLKGNVKKQIGVATVLLEKEKENRVIPQGDCEETTSMVVNQNDSEELVGGVRDDEIPDAKSSRTENVPVVKPSNAMDVQTIDPMP